jgi:hypothetical protein
LIGQAHWPDRLRVPPAQGGAEEIGASAGRGGGACDGFATQVPFLNSCQGKHWLESDCAIAGNELKKASQPKMTAAAEKRVMLKPPAFPNRRKILATKSPRQYSQSSPCCVIWATFPAFSAGIG